jgi:hypothetical protein
MPHFQTREVCRDQTSALAGIDRRLLLGSTVGSCYRLLLGSTAIVRDVVPATPSSTPTPASSPAGEHEPEVDEENLDVDHDDAPLRIRAIDDLIRDAEPPGLARRVLNAELNFTSAEEPTSFKEAEQDAA